MAVKGKKKSLQQLVSIIESLRSPKGCPWDREQTMETLKTYLIEEVYEIIEAIEGDDLDALKEELGDLLFHIVFLSRIAEEQGAFNISDVIDRVSRKMITRHPHVFGEKKVSSSKEVEKSWSDLKEKEKYHRSSVLNGIPQHLPALLRAYRITERANRAGFDWEKAEDAYKKLDEEINELNQALSQGNCRKVEDEMGDVLFVLVNVARLIGINPEESLRKTTEKFIKRFQYVEENLGRSRRSLRETPVDEIHRLWAHSKGKK